MNVINQILIILNHHFNVTVKKKKVTLELSPSPLLGVSGFLDSVWKRKKSVSGDNKIDNWLEVLLSDKISDKVSPTHELI